MTTVKKPNLHGPRFRNSYLTVLNVKTFDAFKEKYPEYASLTNKEFKKIVMTFNGLITEGIIENRNGVELPEGLGFIFIGTCPSAKKRCIDFKKSTELGQLVIHRNWDSDNKLMKIFYTNRSTKYPFQNKQVWAFTATKPFRHRASVAYKQDYSRYIEVNPTTKISAMFDKIRTKQYMENLKPILPENYNEFKI